jgi:hypothetical protein
MISFMIAVVFRHSVITAAGEMTKLPPTLSGDLLGVG